MEKREKQVRYFGGEGYAPRLREATEGSTGRTVEGYAVVFGKESCLIADWDGVYREVIEPGAVTEERLREMDIKMTIWHNRERLLARWNKGAGTLKLSVDETGVKYSFDAPATPDGDTAVELVKRGDLGGASFTYWSDERSSVRYTKGAEGELLRHVDRIDEVFELTLASDPAYAETTASAREALARERERLDREESRPQAAAFRLRDDSRRRAAE